MDELTASLALDPDRAFDAVVDTYGALLFGLARRVCGNTQDAEEVTQDGFVRAYRALRSYEPERIRDLHLRAWLATIVLNLARNRVARRRGADRVEPLSEVHLSRPGTDDPARDAERQDEARRWRALVDGLPPHLRVPLVLRHVEGLPYAEIAEVLGRPVGTVKAQVHRAARDLRVAWERSEVAETRRAPSVTRRRQTRTTIQTATAGGPAGATRAAAQGTAR